jgi:hypothetical protein
MFGLFKKATPVQPGAVAMIRKEYGKQFPQISRSSLLNVQQIVNGKAIVQFFNDKATAILAAEIPVSALVKVD